MISARNHVALKPGPAPALALLPLLVLLLP